VGKAVDAEILARRKVLDLDFAITAAKHAVNPKRAKEMWGTLALFMQGDVTRSK